jgi:H+-transporting ATPase
MPGSEFYDFVEGADGFAEVFPQHKYNVVEILQQRGYLVAMTGDGVNDAPSLKKADTGIAVQGASDAACSAADIVFLAPGLSAIIDALKTSRQIFHRMYAYVVYRIALSLHLEIFLGLWIAILNESLNLQLVVFIAIFADIGKTCFLGSSMHVLTELQRPWLSLTIMHRTAELRSNGTCQNFGECQSSLASFWL